MLAVPQAARGEEGGWLQRTRVALAKVTGAKTEPGDLACTPAEHDRRAWHSLVDAETGCHFDHEHKDDPREVADTLGPVGALSRLREIALPWTFDRGGDPSTRPHEGWGWIVRRDLECDSRFTDGCLTDFRVQVHAVMASPGATRRFHPFSLEARACLETDPDRCGVIRTGGWGDFGHLEVDGRHVPLPDDPERLGAGGRRIHSVERGDPNVGTWFGRHALATVAFQTNRMWGLIMPDRPFDLHLFCPDALCGNNASTLQAHAIGFMVPEYLDDDRDGLVSYMGFTDRHGEIVEGCNQVGIDCVPLELLDMPVGAFEYRDDSRGWLQGTDHDTSPANQSWIRYPN